jgi:hypothetical protein
VGPFLSRKRARAGSPRYRGKVKLMITLLRALMLSAILMTLAVAQQAQQESGPIERENLIQALKTGKLPEQKAIEVITKQKLNFVMTTEYAEEFHQLGATETLIYTLWKNDAFVVKYGPPLTKDAIVALLESGVPSPRIERILELRKAKLVLDAPASKEIHDAGGSDSLLGVILTNLVVAVEEPGTEPVKTQPAVDDISRKYSELMAEAEKRVNAGDYRQAIELAGDAKKLDRSRPQAYSLSGYVWLYDLDHIPTARTEYGDAIDKGGTVVFRVEHSDGVSKITRRHETCTGIMSITKKKVRYEANNKQHIIEFSEDQIRKLDRGGKGPLGGGVVVTLNVGANKPQKEIFFSARRKDKKEEEDLIIDMIRK